MSYRFPTGLGSLSLCSIAAAVLTACGGGDGSSGATNAGTGTLLAAAGATNPVAMSDGAATASAEPDTSALSVKAGSERTATLAAQGQNFLVNGTMTVRYGVGTTWVSKQVTDAGSCTTDYFGKDPRPGTNKTCVVAWTATDSVTTAPTAALPTAEGGTFYVFGAGSVRYGANDRWITKTVTGRATCNNDFFGKDPVYGTVKACQALNADGTPIVTIAAAPAPAPAPAASTAPSAPVIAAPVIPAGSLLPVIDPAKIPGPGRVFNDFRVGPANLSNPVNVPVASDIGAVRLHCEFSHFSYGDPIVAPGGVGSHLHVFFGNSAVDVGSTPESVRNSGGSSCDGGIANRTAYWMPAIIDTRDGSAVKPVDALVYYKQNYEGVQAADIKPFPQGLRMVVGNPNSSAEQSASGSVFFGCEQPSGFLNTPLNLAAGCPAGSVFTLTARFPQCWDGVNIDSPDHRSHMANASNGCPATHPVPLPGVTINVHYLVPDDNATLNWRFSSDNYGKNIPGGYSLHADWLNGWNPDILQTWVTQCLNKQLNCWVDVLGDGRILY